MTVVYFDRNVFADICDLRGSLLQTDVAKIQQAVQAGRITILASHTLIEETLSVLRTKQNYDKHIQTVLDLVDRKNLIKPHMQILREDCESYAFRKNFLPRTMMMPGRIRDLLDLSLNQQRLISLADEIDCYYVDAAANIQAWLDKISVRAKDFEEAWINLSLGIVEDLIKPMGRPLRRGCSARGISRMLNIKSVRLYAIYRCWITYSYCLRSDGVPGKMKSGDGGDFLHAVSASAADIFVTQERKDRQGKLPYVLGLVTTPGLNVMSLREFIATL